MSHAQEFEITVPEGKQGGDEIMVQFAGDAGRRPLAHVLEVSKLRLDAPEQKFLPQTALPC